VVHPGAQLYLNDGMIQLEVTAIRGDDVECRIVIGGELRSRKGLNLPGLHLGMSAFTERDRECLRFALEHGVDAVSQSFVESAADVHAVREAAGALGHHPFLFAKIERAGAIAEIDPILEAADGIMIARGDLGVEVPIERIAVLQKQLMQKAVRAGKPVITATQMLESMTLSRQPTRAEVTDVANAILDGTDCVMLSAESAMGRYPVEAVETLARIAAATEPHRSPTNPWDTLMSQNPGWNYSMTDHIAVGIGAMLRLSTPAAVCVPTRSGATARTITRSRLPVWIAAATADLAVSRSLQFSYGVIPMIETDDRQDWSAFIRRWAHDHGLPGRTAILVQGPSKLNPTANHQIQLVALESSPMP
jgi:pyruvate kinase